MNLNPISLWLLILGMPDLIHISCLLTLALSWVPCNSCQTCSHMFSSYPFSHKNNDHPPRHVKSAFLFFDALRWCFGRSTNDAGNGRPGYVGPSPPKTREMSQNSEAIPAQSCPPIAGQRAKWRHYLKACFGMLDAPVSGEIGPSNMAVDIHTPNALPGHLTQQNSDPASWCEFGVVALPL